MLGMFAYMLKAKRVLEVGMFTGYGTLTIAESLPEDGKIYACEIDPFLKRFSKVAGIIATPRSKSRNERRPSRLASPA